MEPTSEIWVYVGTYTTGESEGIYVYRLDSASGALIPADVTTGIDNPSFLAIHANRRCLYATNEVHEFAGHPGGAVSAFTYGASPCHLIVDRTGQYVIVANYSAGSVTVLPIKEHGELGPHTDLAQHRGKGIHPTRQEGPHAHSVNADPGRDRLLVADLGLDRIVLYRLDRQRGVLMPCQVPWAATRPGAGPRHMIFHPTGPYLYVINELDSTVSVFSYDVAQGALREIQWITTLPDGYRGHNTCADVHISSCGRYLYGSNRGHDSIVVYRVDPHDGRLSVVTHVSTRGRTPRNFGIDPNGRYLLAANQDSDSITTFRIDAATGIPVATGLTTHVPTPVCVLVYRR